MKKFKRYFNKLFSDQVVKKVNIKYNLSHSFDYGNCGFCSGSGKINCFKCDIYYKNKNYNEKKCTNCIDGLIECYFCRGSGKCHQIFSC